MASLKEIFFKKGEAGYKVFTFPQDVTSATLTLTLSGDDFKSDSDFEKSYGDNNEARLHFDSDDTNDPGEYDGELKAEYDSDNTDISYIKIYIDSPEAALRIDDIRKAIWDTTDNDLLNEEEITDSLLYQARQRCVDYWNSKPIGNEYSVDGFPNEYKEEWLNGSIGYALRTLAMKYKRNEMNYQAGGIQIADKKGKAEAYLQMAQMYLSEWRNFVKNEQYVNSVKRGFQSLKGWS